MNSSLKLIKKEITKKVLELVKEHTKMKYGAKADVCFMTLQDNLVTFETSNTRGAVPVTNNNFDKIIRKLCGENILQINGLPAPEEEPSILKLLPGINLVKHLGVRKTIKFISDWRGKSEVTINKDGKETKIVIVEYII